MSIWIIGLLLLAVLAWIGYLEGAVSAMISLVGLILAIYLSVPLGPAIAPVLRLVGVSNPYLLLVLPPLVVFVLFMLAFAGISFAANWRIRLQLKYKADDVQRMRWERLNKRLGIAAGLVRGCVCVLLVTVIIYVAGYASVQLTNDNSPAILQVLSSVRKDLVSSGLDKTAARFDPASESFYAASDVLGLVYQNPLLHSRLGDYPAFLSLGERSEFQEIATDTEFNQMLQSQDSITKIMNHPKVQAIVKNPEIMQTLMSVDLQDLQQYLTTGKSPKFAEERILGRWQVNVPVSLTELKKASTNSIFAGISWIDLRNSSSPILGGITLKFTPENKVYLKVQPKEAPAGTATQGPTAGPTGPPPGGAPSPGTAPTPRSLTSRIMPQGDPQQTEYQRRMIQRYGRYGSTPPSSQPAVVVPAAPPPRPPPENPLKKLVSAEGSWQRKEDTYAISLAFPASKPPIIASVREDRMVLAAGPFTLVCDRQ
jgi:uncharacterized membrane protein required for colicin V production